MIDPRCLKPSELCQLLNSTPLGEVISERLLHRHRNRAGLRIGDGKTVDLLRYAAWLVVERHRQQTGPAMRGDYEEIKERSRARNVALSLAGRDIGELPPVANPARKAQAASDFRFFCDSYFPLTFSLPWSQDHLRVIAKIEQAVLRGGLFAMAMPRGSGKSSISECACIWAVLYGHREFVCLIGSDEGHAMDMLDAIKMELEGNDLLVEDFPEVVFPIHSLDGIANRCNGQLYNGERTHIGWTAREVILPTLAPKGWGDNPDLRPFVRPDGLSRASGAIIKVAGITGRIRGMKYKRTDGKTVRPTLVVLDDPQTDESARSPSQCAKREEILAGAVLGLAGPGVKISGIMPCTVICPGDMADAILDRDRHPEWNGERTKLVYSFPSDEKRWQRYAELRAESLRQGHEGEEATAYYRDNQVEMDAGAVVAWSERFNHDEISAIQHAMNLRLRNESAFFAEYQNEPRVLALAVGRRELHADALVSRLTHVPLGQVPRECTRLTAFIDCGNLLWWSVCGWTESFSGTVIDYGTWPPQSRSYFTKADAKPTIQDRFPGLSDDAALYAALQALMSEIVGKSYIRHETGEPCKLDLCLIDSGWQTDAIFQVCRQSAFSPILKPSKGWGASKTARPMREWPIRTGERVGLDWRLTRVGGPKRGQQVIFDADSWKSFAASRWTVPMGGAGCWTLNGDKPYTHRLMADHLTAEFCEPMSSRGRTWEKWHLRPGRDNDWFDCLVGCAVGASVLGVQWSPATAAGTDEAPRPRVKRKSLAEAMKGKEVLKL